MKNTNDEEQTTFELTFPMSFIVITCNDDSETLMQMISTLPQGCEVCILKNGSAAAAELEAGLHEPQTMIKDGRLWRVQAWYWDRFSFAEARNHSANLATNDWVMWIDSDDRLASCQHDIIRRVALEAAPGVGCAFAGVTSYEPQQTLHPQDRGNQTASYQCRMYRRSTGATWIGDIHEQIYPQIQKLGWNYVNTAVCVIHTGYNVGPSQRVAKMQRNVDMLIRWLADVTPQHEAYGLRGYWEKALEDSVIALGALKDFERTLTGN